MQAWNLRRFIWRTLIGWLVIVPIILMVFRLSDPLEELHFFLSREPFILLSLIGSGPIIGVLSTWYFLLRDPLQKPAMILTPIAAWVMCFLIIGIDLQGREGMEGLITIFLLAPMVMPIALMITIIAIRDLLKQKSTGMKTLSK